MFRISHDELSNAHRRGFISEEGRLVKLRGLPFNASNKDIKDFLTGTLIHPSSILLSGSYDGYLAVWFLGYL